MNELEQFIDGLLRAAKLDALPEQARVEAAERIADQVQRRIGLVVLAHLDDDGVHAYTQLIERAAPASDVQEFLVARIPDFSEKIRAALDAFAAEFLAAAAPRTS